MPVKHWSFAGLILTYRCNARCASCYLGCGPDCGEEMSVETAMFLWQSLAEASPHGCRIHLTGGEPFLDWPRLLEICRQGYRAGLSREGGAGPLQKVETNAFWATDERIVRDRIKALAEAGMGKLAISADPYHQQYVPIERCRLAARLAEEMLGSARVQVRWRDWLADGFDTADLDPAERAALFARYGVAGRDRLGGRAAGVLAGLLTGDDRKGCQKTLCDFADIHCGEVLLRGRGVHVDGRGRIMPGTCAGIVLGRVKTPDRTEYESAIACASVAEVWQKLYDNYAHRPVLGRLAMGGPVSLAGGLAPTGRPNQYAGKCHLCWHVRKERFLAGLDSEELGPGWMYQAEKTDDG